MFTQGMDNAIMCTLLSIDVDMVYSVDRTFILQFMPSNALDTFSGVNYTTVTILENGTNITGNHKTLKLYIFVHRSSIS